MTLSIRQDEDTSDELVSAVRRRLEGLATERDVLQARRQQIEQDLDRLSAEIGHLTSLLVLHGREADAPLTLHSEEARVRPVTVADQVAEILREARSPLHYREIERRMRAKGYFTAGGQDPANTLLAKYFNDARLYRPSRGTYALREWQPNAPSVGTKSKKRERKGA